MLKIYYRIKHHLIDKRGSVLIYAITLIFILSLMGGIIANTILLGSRDAYNQLHSTQEFYLAEAGIMRAWKAFKDGETDLSTILKGDDGIAQTTDDGLLSFGTTVNLEDGTYSVVVTDNNDGDADLYTDADNIVLVTSTGSLSTTQTTRTVRAYMEIIPPASPVNVRSAIVAAGPIKTLGTLVVDGRNHDIDGNLIFGSGMLGISTMQTFQQSGNSKVGGTNNGVDYSPSKPGDAAVIEENADWSAAGGFPETPDKMMGLPEGTLKAIAQSGNNGSQYVTDPNNLNLPLLGVTYVELPSGDTWQSMDFGESRGILIVHNAAKNAVIKNLNGGTFRGILIADDIVHIHCTIIGAVISLTPTPSTGNCIGNGNGDALYSGQAISTATQEAIGPMVAMKSWFY